MRNIGVLAGLGLVVTLAGCADTSMVEVSVPRPWIHEPQRAVGHRGNPDIVTGTDFEEARRLRWLAPQERPEDRDLQAPGPIHRFRYTARRPLPRPAYVPPPPVNYATPAPAGQGFGFPPSSTIQREPLAPALPRPLNHTDALNSGS